jgi:hypothetical protein
MKTPNPRSSIRSPRERASFIELKSASTACSAFNFGYAGLVGKAIDDIEFDHGNVASGSGEHSLAFQFGKLASICASRMIERRANNLSSFTVESGWFPPQ